MNINKQISKFKSQINQASTVNAEDINKISLAVENAQKVLIDLSDESFKNKVFFALENNIDINSAFIDDFSDSNYINVFKSKAYTYNFQEKSISAVNETAQVYSIKYMSKLKGTIQNVILLVDDYIPNGASINYFISIDDNNYYPIKKNKEVPTDIKEGAVCVIKAVLNKNAFGQTPKIYGWAVLYYDKVVRLLYSIKNIGLSDNDNFEAQVLGDTILIRDPQKDDKLVAVSQGEGISHVKLTYREDGKLDTVETNVLNDIIEEKLNYGEYSKSDGTIEEVLLSTTKIRPNIIIE